ncbi:hypothetical protein [Mastigocoleus testarum]|nr:hypothetical protein [Mastigocoleus testarum]
MSKSFSASKSNSSIEFRRRILFSLIWFLMLPVVPLIQASIFLSTTSRKQDSECPKPTKVYYLTVLPEISKQVIKLNPPARKIVIAVKPGDVAIPCGCNLKIYTCVSGKNLNITAEPSNLIQEFWVQNPLSHNVRLTITVYEH